MQRIDLQEKMHLCKVFSNSEKITTRKKATLSSNPVSLGHRYSTLGSEKKFAHTSHYHLACQCNDKLAKFGLHQ